MDETFKCVADHLYRRQYKRQPASGGRNIMRSLLIGRVSVESSRLVRKRRQRGRA